MSALRSSPPEPSGMAEALGLEVTDWHPGRCAVEVTVAPMHLNKGGAVHGGVLTTMLDMALGGALVASLTTEEWCATTQLTTSFLDAAKEGERLQAKGHVVRRGRHVAHLAGEVLVGQRVVASASGTWAIWSSRPASMGLRRSVAVLQRLASMETRPARGEGLFQSDGRTLHSTLAVRAGPETEPHGPPLFPGVGSLHLHEVVQHGGDPPMHDASFVLVRDERHRLVLRCTPTGAEVVVEEGARSLRAGPIGPEGWRWRCVLGEGARLEVMLWLNGSQHGAVADAVWTYEGPNS